MTGLRKTMLVAAAAILAFGPFAGASVALAEMTAADKNVTVSPDSTMVAFTRGNDLWVRSIADSVETRLTFDGSDLVLNGYASWVYYEEIFGRSSNYRAFWWSPDSRSIAYYRFDNSGVPVFPIFSPFGQNGSLSMTRYPNAGQTNPDVKVGIVSLDSGETVWADFDYSLDQYFGTPFWSPDSEELYVQREPRRQSKLDLYAVNVSDGSLRHVYGEEYPTWVEWIDGMLFTPDGLYMARDFETGWAQIYFLGYDGTLKRLTDGKNWDIRLLQTDGKGNVWFTAKRDSRLHSALYVLDRKGKVSMLTDPQYSVSGVQFGDGFRDFTATLSNARTPSMTVKGRSNRFDCEVLDQTEVADTLSLPYPEIVRIENDGFDLYALMSLPENFDPEKKYPVVMQLYGGPGTPYVRDIWQDRDASDDWCFHNGIIYIVCDPRSSGENGRKGMDQAFRRMTVIELQDYIAWAKWLGSLPYVDSSRIGVKGFSFGGTTTAMLVLRYPEYFRCGIAGGGVYDWTLYDSHYTERYMDTPQDNPDGYAEASVIKWVPKVFGKETGSDRLPLPGALRLTHGTGDDNVHYQNTLLLMDSLQKEGYQFEVMLYPDGMHGYRGLQGKHDKVAEECFWTRWLKSCN